MMQIETIRRTMLFQGMSEESSAAALAALAAEEGRYEKGETVLRSGNVTDRMGLILEGSVTIETNDLWGNRTILSHVGKEQFFAEAYALLGDEPMLVDAVANADSLILFLRPGGLRRLSAAEYPWQPLLVANLLRISARKNLLLSERSIHTAPKSARGRIMSYLNTVALQKRSREFDIPFDRQQMADYLNLDRSALSRELARMRDDGILESRKRHFILKAEDRICRESL